MSSDPNLPPDANYKPVPPSVDPTAPLVPTAPSSTGLEPNVAAGLAAIFPLLGGVIFILLEKRNPYVRFWAMQSIFFGATVLVFRIAMYLLISILSFLGILWFLLSAIVGLGILILWVITIIQAFSGKEWEIPVLGKMARAQLSRAPTL